MLPDIYEPRLPPRSKQLEALVKGWRRPGFGYLMEMGVGKSKTVIDNFCLLAHTDNVFGLIIFASKSVYANWSRMSDERPGELQKHLWDNLRHEARVYTWKNSRSRANLQAQRNILDTASPGIRVLVMNIEAISQGGPTAMDLCSQFLRRHRSMIVVDESILMQDMKSRRTKLLHQLGQRAAYRRILTGFVSGGSPTQVYPQFHFLEPGCLGYRSLVAFRMRYCKLREIPVGNRTVKIEVGTQNLDELAERIAEHSFRARKSECLDLPDKIYLEERAVPLTGEQNRIYSELKKSAMVELKKEAYVTTQSVLTQVLRLQQVASGHVRSDDGEVRRIEHNRLQILHEVLEKTDEQVIIWCNYQENVLEVQDFLAEKYGREAVARWHGQVKHEQRELEETDFQMGRRRFMLATQAAGARGREWTAGTLVIYYTNHPSLELRVQSEDRAHRLGQTKPVAYLNLVAEGTVEEGIISNLRAGRSVVDAIMSDGPSKWL